MSDVPYPELGDAAQTPMDYKDRCTKLQAVLEYNERQLADARSTNNRLRSILNEIEDVISKRWRTE